MSNRLGFITAAIFLVFTSSHAQAADCPAGTSGKVIQVIEWSANAPNHFGVATLQVTLVSRSNLAIKRVDGYLIFRDTKGSQIDDFPIDGALQIPAGGQVISKAILRKSPMTEMEASDIIGFACARSVTFADGTKRVF